jgi:excisionase family DNA binding protein
MPAGSVTVLNPASWAGRVGQLVALLAAAERWPERHRVIPDAGGMAARSILLLADPSYWSVHVEELREALTDRANGQVPVTRSVGDGIGAAAESPGRLTLTVEEAATALGISRALAYEAVRRGEIPAIKVGRRILVPGSAIRQMLEIPLSGSCELADGERTTP